MNRTDLDIVLRAVRDLEFVNAVLDGLRFAGLDQNPSGIRDLHFSATHSLRQLLIRLGQ